MEKLNGKHTEQTVTNALPALESVGNAKVSLFVPSVSKTGELVHEETHKHLTAYAASVIARCFGGYTVTRGHGGYVMPDGTLARESVSIVSAYAKLDNSQDSINALRTVRDLAYILKDIFNQESVLLTVEPVSAVYFL